MRIRDLATKYAESAKKDNIKWIYFRVFSVFRVQKSPPPLQNTPILKSLTSAQHPAVLNRFGNVRHLHPLRVG